MRMNTNETGRPRGLGKVYGFSLRRLLCAKANIVSLVLFVVLIAAAVPVYSILAGKGASPVAETAEKAAAAMLEGAGVPQEARAVLDKPVSSSGAAIGGGNADTFAPAYAASILVMFISVLASSYIVRSVTEEKVSRLAETLIVSVDPFALALGKILAVLSYVGDQLVFVGGSLAYGPVLDEEAAKKTAQSALAPTPGYLCRTS